MNTPTTVRNNASHNPKNCKMIYQKVADSTEALIHCILTWELALTAKELVKFPQSAFNNTPSYKH